MFNADLIRLERLLVAALDAQMKRDIRQVACLTLDAQFYMESVCAELTERREPLTPTEYAALRKVQGLMEVNVRVGQAQMGSMAQPVRNMGQEHFHATYQPGRPHQTVM